MTGWEVAVRTRLTHYLSVRSGGQVDLEVGEQQGAAVRVNGAFVAATGRICDVLGPVMQAAKSSGGDRSLFLAEPRGQPPPPRDIPSLPADLSAILLDTASEVAAALNTTDSSSVITIRVVGQVTRVYNSSGVRTGNTDSWAAISAFVFSQGKWTVATAGIDVQDITGSTLNTVRATLVAAALPAGDPGVVRSRLARDGLLVVRPYAAAQLLEAIAPALIGGRIAGGWRQEGLPVSVRERGRPGATVDDEGTAGVDTDIIARGRPVGRLYDCAAAHAAGAVSSGSGWRDSILVRPGLKHRNLVLSVDAGGQSSPPAEIGVHVSRLSGIKIARDGSMRCFADCLLRADTGPGVSCRLPVTGNVLTVIGGIAGGGVAPESLMPLDGHCSAPWLVTGDLSLGEDIHV